MNRSVPDRWDQACALPVTRRAVLSLGIRGALGACVAIGAFSGLGALVGCYRAPGTARDQLIFISEEKEIAMGVQAFHEVLKQARLSENPEINDMVHRVGQRIAEAAHKPEYHWEFAVIQDDRVINAFALPGERWRSLPASCAIPRMKRDWPLSWDMRWRTPSNATGRNG